MIENTVYNDCNKALTYFQGNNDVDSSGSETNCQQEYFQGNGDVDPDGEQEHSDDKMQEDHDSGSDQPPLYNPLRRLAAAATMPYRSKIGISTSWRFQIELADLLACHRTDLKVYDDLISLVKNHSSEHKLKFLPTSLMNRE